MTTYVYRPYIRWSAHAMLLLGLAPLTLFVFVASRVRTPTTMDLVNVTVGVAVCTVAWWFFRRMSQTQFTLDDHTLSVRRPGSHIVLPYAQVEALTFRPLPGGGGWMTLRGAGQRIWVFATLHHPEAFLRQLKQQLDAADNTASYDRTRLFAFLTNAAQASQVLDATYAWRWRGLGWTLASAAVGVAQYAVFNPAGTYIGVAMLVAFIYATLPLPIFVILHTLATAQVRRSANLEAFTYPPPNPEQVERVLRWFPVLLVVAWVAIGAILFR